MKHGEFKIGLEFYMSSKRYRVTDVGTRIVAAIRVSGPHEVVRSRTLPDGTHETKHVSYTRQQAQARGIFNGPSYGVVEYLIDEEDQLGCIRIIDLFFDPDYAD
jgi:hypothetical protein